MAKILQWLLLSALTLVFYDGLGQCIPCPAPDPDPEQNPYNSARIVVLSGGNVEFNFRSIQDYRTGLTKTNATVLGISICNCPGNADTQITGWELYFDTDDTEFVGQDPLNTLPLCMLEAGAQPRIGWVGNDVQFSQEPLYNIPAPNPIAWETANPVGTPIDRSWSQDQINISYYFAVPPTNAACIGVQEFPLINDPVLGDFYMVSVSFTLIPICNVCTDIDY